MKVFLDTSSLFKLYHKEAGTTDLENMFSTLKITEVFLSEISKIEFVSTVWKKIRTKEITEPEGLTTLNLFDNDANKYTFIATNTIILENARILIKKYGMQGLRTLDSIQLATCVTLSQYANTFFTADNLLNFFFKAEGLPTELPEM